MTTDQPTNTLTEGEREAVCFCDAVHDCQTTADSRKLAATCDANAIMVARIKADAYAAGLAARTPTETGDDLRDRVTALADEWERTGERLQGVPAAQTWFLLSARLRGALAASSAPVVSRPEAVVKAEALREAADTTHSRFEHSLLNTEECDWVRDWLRARASSLATDPEQGGEPVVSRPEAVSWVMSLDEARDLLGWLRHNRPLGMPDEVFSGLLDAIRAASLEER